MGNTGVCIVAQFSVADPRGTASPPPFLDFCSFFSIKRVQNLSQNAGNVHFRDSNFQHFLGVGMPPDPPRKLTPSALVGVPPFKNPESGPGFLCSTLVSEILFEVLC